MDTNDPNFAIPLSKLAQHGYPGSRASHYRAIAEGRLTTTKLGTRSFVLKKDADAWLSSLPRQTGKAGAITLSAAEHAVKKLVDAIERGEVDRTVAFARMSAIVEKVPEHA